MSGTVIATLRTDFDRGFSVDLHQHDFHLLSWSETATVTHHTADRDWLVPPTHALWMPAGVPHAVAVVRGGLGHGVALTGETPWSEPTGVLATPLVRELILHLNADPGRARARAEALLVELLEPVPSTTFTLPVPTDPRLRDITDVLARNPADDRDLAAWADHAATSVRTLTRLFQAETGMTFAQWRTRCRIRAALTLLADGTPVAVTARAVGYRKPGAFAEAFRRVTGRSPGEVG
ncbi:AraC family transcriptional regulator [Pseudonocardia sp. WMMC193]|uniref:helix-turn-helix transcriptional regulator n=1 Tax=Pseudonocardia sp. WMMC193 TaxID=2911965 RepID=UPI001F401609|nr:AraC family transcriptional regulator [Pseudonocardia sp. WMMC193]MCF7548449.1 AraC family transcriptional regulator [Pseudonocardia sp. WMMC193]